ncbi:hypothetical protein ACET3Z_010528 [Daucus carota]
MHDDSNYLSPVKEEQIDEAHDDEVIDLTTDDEEEQRRQSQHGNPIETQKPIDFKTTHQEWKDEFLQESKQRLFQ